MLSQSNGPKPLVSIVVPVYNEEGNLRELRRRLELVLEGLSGYEFEVILIDNGSVDSSSSICNEFVDADTKYRYVQFSRNFGIEASFFAGVTYANGDALLYLFSDLQDPPEAIPVMIEKWRQGYDVVYGELQKRSDQNLMKTLGAGIAYKLIYWMSDVKIPVNATDFRLLSRPVIDAVKACGERNRYMRGLTHWSGFRQIGFPFERSPRTSGKSSAGLIWCFKYAINAIVAFSTKPLRLASLVGLLTTGASLLGAVFWVVITILSRRGDIGISPPPLGWTTMALLIFFFGGVQCLFMGILGEYLAGVHVETKGRPAWWVASQKGFPARSESRS